MISAVNNSPNFTGIVPLRVFVDGQQQFEPAIVRSATRKLTSALIKPKENPELAELFAKYDPQYRKGGYPAKAKPSDFFRLIIDRYRGIFLATGAQTKRLNELGKDIGVEKALCRERRTESSLDLLVAKRKYSDTLATMLSSANLRLCEMSDRWCPLTIDLIVQGKKVNAKFNT